VGYGPCVFLRGVRTWRKVSGLSRSRASTSATESIKAPVSRLYAHRFGVKGFYAATGRGLPRAGSAESRASAVDRLMRSRHRGPTH
jgi:hypothetical protein